jgi:hypothetical protein
MLQLERLAIYMLFGVGGCTGEVSAGPTGGLASIAGVLNIRWDLRSVHLLACFSVSAAEAPLQLGSSVSSVDSMPNSKHRQVEGEGWKAITFLRRVGVGCKQFITLKDLLPIQYRLDLLSPEYICSLRFRVVL